MKKIILGVVIAGIAILCNSASAGCCRGLTKTLEKLEKDTGKALGKAAGDVARETGKTAKNIGQVVGKAGGDAAAATQKAGNDTWKESGRAVENVEELGTAVRKFVVGTVDDKIDAVAVAQKRIREGKFADAFWHYNISPLKDSEERAAQLAQESSLANAVGGVAAAAYGGPGGAAAYSAWYTYRATGDVNLALRAGMISGATSAALSAVDGMPVTKETVASDIAKKAIVAGAIGGLAVAAAGGDGDALREGFLRSGGMILIQDAYREYTGGQDLTNTVKSPTNSAFCALTAPTLATSPNCSPPLDWFKKNADGTLADGPVLDMSKVDPKYSYLGAAAKAGKSHWLFSETSMIMNGFAKVPGMNAMAIFHDQWVITAPLSGWTNQATIIPAVVVTYMGTETGVQNLIRDTLELQKANKAPEGGAPDTLAGPISSDLIKNVAVSGQPSNITVLNKDARKQRLENSYLCTKKLETSRVVTRIRGGAQLKVSQKTVHESKMITRGIFIAKGETSDQLACVVVYQKSDERLDDLAPWHALTDRSYCDAKAEQLVLEHSQSGWSCLAR